MATPEDWRGFAKDFEQIILRDTRARGIFASYYPQGSHGGGVSVTGLAGEWQVGSVAQCLRDADEDAFKRFARRAAVTAGCPDHPDSWVYWLEGIRSADIAPDEWGDWNISNGDETTTIHEITIRNICYVSMRYCEFLARNAAPLPRAPEPPAQAQTGVTAESQPCSWNKVAIEFTSEERVQVTANEQLLASQNYADMGFEDRRTKLPNKAWHALKQLAEASDEHRGASAELKGERLGSQYEKRLQDIRRALRAYFSREGFVIPPDSDPLPCKNGSVRPVFKISTRPSYQT